MSKRAIIIRHVHFEDLGSLAEPLRQFGYHIRYLEAGGDDLTLPELDDADLLVVLGGPIGVYDDATYPFLSDEIALLRRRLRHPARPTLGLCLGAQLIASALGAPVAPIGTKEIGFAPVELTPDGWKSPLRHLDGTNVLHWHGDAFAIPEGAVHLAATSTCATQAFAFGRTVLGLQFHPEFDSGAGIEPWLIGHASELASAAIDPRPIRADATRFGVALRDATQRMLTEWLEGLERDPRAEVALERRGPEEAFRPAAPVEMTK